MNPCLVCCVRCTKWIPVLFLMSILSWAYYAYIVELCVYNVGELAKKVIYIFLFHVFLLMFLWAYGMTVFTKPARPTDEFYLNQTDIYQLEIAQNDTATKMIIEKKAKQLPILTRTNTLQARYCDKCKCIKPDRAHHCGTCHQCVLKMDHHCPWVNNCVGHSNYKFFILFLSYAFLLCMYIACTSFEYFVEFWNEIQNFKPGRFHLLFLFFVSIMFAISVFSLLAYHIYLVARNCTTLESFRAPIFHATGQPDQNGFNVRIRDNFQQVFGTNLLLAVLPIKSNTNNGIVYTESDWQKSEREAECRTSPPNQSSDALLSNDRFQSVNENGIVMDRS